MAYNPPPNWPKPPEGWTPPPGWQPDPAWGPAPEGWQVWTEDERVPDSASAAPSPRAKKGRPRWLVPAIVGVVALFIGVGIGSAGSATAPESDPTPAPTVTVDPSADVQAELDARSADLDEREEQLDARQAELDQREAAISGQEAELEAGTIPGDGVYLVGSDIQPGTYRSTTTGSCYWARLSGTSGEFSELIANDNVTGQAIVTIQSSDVAFESSGCGDWQLQR